MWLEFHGETFTPRSTRAKHCFLRSWFASLPKGPFRTKNSTESKFTTASKKRYGNSKTLQRVLRSACFSRKKKQENGTESEKLRQEQNTTDSGAVLFLVQKGPLGSHLLSRRLSISLFLLALPVTACFCFSSSSCPLPQPKTKVQYRPVSGVVLKKSRSSAIIPW